MKSFIIICKERVKDTRSYLDSKPVQNLLEKPRRISRAAWHAMEIAGSEQTLLDYQAGKMYLPDGKVLDVVSGTLLLESGEESKAGLKKSDGGQYVSLRYDNIYDPDQGHKYYFNEAGAHQMIVGVHQLIIAMEVYWWYASIGSEAGKSYEELFLAGDVNHMAGNRSSNRLESLEVVTHSDNCAHAQFMCDCARMGSFGAHKVIRKTRKGREVVTYNLDIPVSARGMSNDPDE